MNSQPLTKSTFLGGALAGFCKRAANHMPVWLWPLQTSVQSWFSLCKWAVASMWRGLCLVWACVRAVCVNEQSLYLEVLKAWSIKPELKSCDEEQPVSKSTFCSAWWCALRRRFYCIWYRTNLVACKLYIGDIPNLSICQIHSQCSYHLLSCVEAIMKVQAWMVVNIMHMNIFYGAEKN